MATTRIVKQTKKDTEGDILALCNSGESWSPRYKSGAISDINSGNIVYRVKSSNGPVVQVVHGETGDYLRSHADATTSDNLDNLPDC